MRKGITYILVAVFCIALVSELASAQTYYYTNDAFEKNFGNTKLTADASTRSDGTYLFLDNEAFERRFGKPVASPSTLPEDSVTDIDDTSLPEDLNINIVPLDNEGTLDLMPSDNEGTPEIIPTDNAPEGRVVDTNPEGGETASEGEETPEGEGNTIIIPQENEGDAEVVFPDDGETAPLAPEVVLGDVDADNGITKNSDTTKIALIGLLIVVVVVLLIVLFTKEVPDEVEDTDWKETSFFKEIKSSKPKAEVKETKPKEANKKEQDKKETKTEKKEAGKPPASKAKVEETSKETVSDSAKTKPKAEKSDKPFLLKIKEDSE